MSTVELPLISVQTDWDQVAREVVSDKASNSFFWIACYLTGKPSVQGQVEVIKKDNGEYELEGKNGFIVSSLGSRSFKVECSELGAKDIIVYGPKDEIILAEKARPACVDVSPNGRLFATASGSEVFLGNLSEAKVQTILKGHLSDVTAVQFFPSNLVLLTGGADFQLKIWSVIDGSNPVTLRGHTSAITSTAIVEKGRNIISSSRDGTIKLWNCGTASVIATLGKYQCPVNKIVLAKLPSSYQPAAKESLDPVEVGTEDKMVIAALGNGSIRGFHLGTKSEIFASPTGPSALTALVYDETLDIVFAGSESGQITAYSLEKGLEEPVAQWQRNKFPVTSLAIKLSKNGERVLCVASADGALYETSALSSLKTGSSIRVEIEYTGNELESVNEVKVVPGEEKEGYQSIVCSVRDGKLKVY
ncbi:hypothetical protein RMATCC62417_03216 [Rhizopus microsporus]|nr:hypothetical protein RMATCC62417_03216 [Rhizopus microsporus]